MMRFSGSVEPLADIYVGALVEWITSIPFEDWHQQHRLADGQLRPAMMTDPAWHDFGAMVAPVVDALMGRFPGCKPDQPMLSVVMPGHAIEPHTDSQPSSWICRVHVPLTSNPESRFVVGGEAHQMEPGRAYKVNTEAVHSVENAGPTPRIHFMFDVRQ